MANDAPRPAASAVALFRFAVLSEVRVGVLRGQLFAEAVRQVASRPHVGLDGQPRRVSTRSIYRWHAAFVAFGLAGLEPKARESATASEVLDPQLLAYLKKEKEQDPRASIPELLRRAVAAGQLQATREVDRTTVWRAFKRMGVRTRTGRVKPEDRRRFAKNSRLQLVLCDGKHFRAGPTKAKRVALFFLDDATRYVPTVVVGTSESAELFLRGLLALLQRVGRIDHVYFDSGSGFIADDTHQVLSGLDIGFVHGRVRYPEARGKVERFNRTANEALLRDLERKGVDPDCTALELRLEHYLRETYNREPHRSLDGQTPEARFLADDRPLRPYVDPDALRRSFVVREQRVVSNDHVISFRGVQYEVPTGLARQRITFVRDVFDATHLRLEHGDRWIRLHPVDVHANARAARASGVPAAASSAPVPGAASRAAEGALAPITQPDGGFPATDPEEPPWT